jgi:type VI secretion system protein ImpL
MLFDQCQVIASRNVEINYRALKSFFDEKLAGKFPFADIEPGLAGFEEADPEQIKDFYAVFNDAVPPMKSVLEYNNNFGLSGQHAARFIAEMERVREFFSLYLAEDEEKNKDEKADGAKAKTPTLGLKVTFRVNQAHEVMANQIMGWKLVVGQQTFTDSSKAALGQWLLGEPVAVSLRWAKNAPYKPIFAGAHEGAKVSGRTASWRFDNNWSLLRLMTEHAAAKTDLDGFKDVEPHTLKFEVEVDRVEGKDPTGKKFTSRAFVRIALTTADKAKQPLQMPRFPTSAPKLGMLAPVKGD